MKEEMTADEIIRVVDRLIGGVEPTGDDNVDKQIQKDLEKTIDLIWYLIDGVRRSATYINSYEYSVRMVAQTATGALHELMDWIGDMIQTGEIR
jgi:hypothetical protein